MNDKTRREDFKKLVLPNVMKENSIHSELKLGDISRFIYLCCPLFLKFKKKKNYYHLKCIELTGFKFAFLSLSLTLFSIWVSSWFLSLYVAFKSFYQPTSDPHSFIIHIYVDRPPALLLQIILLHASQIKHH